MDKKEQRLKQNKERRTAESDMSEQVKKQGRRAILGAAAIGAMAPNSWTKPVVGAMVLPAHAMTSMPVVCPDIVIDRVTTSIMGSGEVQCSLNFNVLSADSTPLTVTSITNSTLSIGAAVTYEDFPVEITDTAGTLVAWTGGQSSPECGVGSNFASDVVFTVEATCEGALDPITMEFNLTDIAAM